MLTSLRERDGGGDEEEEEERAEVVVLRALLGRWSAIVLFASSQSSFWRAISSPAHPRSLHDPSPRLVLQRHTMEPGQLWNMLIFLAVLVDQAPPSCWLNDSAPPTVAEVEGRRGEGGTTRAQHEWSGRCR